MLTKLQVRPDNYRAANQLFNSGIDNFTGAMEKYSGRIKDRAVNELLGNYSPDQTNLLDSQQQLMSQLSGVGNISPKEALGLAGAATTPYTAQRDYDRGIFTSDRDYQIAQGRLGETSRHNQVMEGRGSYGMTTDDYGNTYVLNKNSGELEMIEGSNQVGTNPKNIVLKTVTDRDGYGNETTRQIPFDKTTGQPVTDGAGVGTKAPALSQQDRDAADATGKALGLLDTISGQYNPDLVGLADNTLAASLNSLGINTADTTKNRVLNATMQNLKANLTAALIKGVPSDKDMKVIEDMLPATSDSEDVFQAKLGNIKEILSKQSQGTKKQILDPRQQGGIVPVSTPGSTETNSTGGSPYGTDYTVIRF